MSKEKTVQNLGKAMPIPGAAKGGLQLPKKEVPQVKDETKSVAQKAKGKTSSPKKDKKAAAPKVKSLFGKRAKRVIAENGLVPNESILANLTEEGQNIINDEKVVIEAYKIENRVAHIAARFGDAGIVNIVVPNVVITNSKNAKPEETIGSIIRVINVLYVERDEKSTTIYSDLLRTTRSDNKKVTIWTNASLEQGLEVEDGVTIVDENAEKTARIKSDSTLFEKFEAPAPKKPKADEGKADEKSEKADAPAKETDTAEKAKPEASAKTENKAAKEEPKK